jgi:2-oxoacid:acceptor oxidoreductase gamma subunit (pyruvate/2-ketoisovalerate family)
MKGYDVVAGLKPDGLAVINTGKKPSELGLKTKARVVTVPAARIAKQIMGRADRVNTALIGAFIAVTSELSLESLERAINSRFSGKAAESNWKALLEAYNEVKNRGNGT